MGKREELIELSEHHDLQASKLFMELEALSMWVKKPGGSSSEKSCKRFMKEYADRMVAKHKKWAALLTEIAHGFIVSDKT